MQGRAIPAHPLTPLPGSERLRVSPSVQAVGRHFTAADPFVVEFQVPPAAVIPGAGDPPDAHDSGVDLAASYPRALDASVIQLEIPAHLDARTDESGETIRRVGTFDRPVFCPLDRPCMWPEETDGRWRAWRIRDEGTGPVATELQLGGVGDDLIKPGSPLDSVVGVWLDPADPPLDALDRVRFEFVGNVPRRATEWLGSPLQLRLRYRSTGLDTAAPTCLMWDADCWQVLPSTQVQGLQLLPDPVAFVRVVAPLDTEVDVPFELRLIALDAWGNPTPVLGSFQPTLDGLPLGSPLVASAQWSLGGTVTIPSAGLGMLGVELPAGVEATVVRQPTQTAAAGSAQYRRLVGDVHFHSGSGSAAPAFAPTAQVGDHSGGFTRGDYALRYVNEVAGLDFGALSEHATRFAGWSLPLGFADFEPGGPCAVDTGEAPTTSDWWTSSQQAAHAYDLAHPAFTAFPAFEWHSRHTGAADKSPLHRVVMYRDFDLLGPHRLPMLPGSTKDLPPQCLIRYLALAGYSADQVLAMPHMMVFNPKNIDWDLSYDDPSSAALASEVDMRTYMAVAEVFSTRNFSGGSPPAGGDTLANAEGVAPDPSTEPFSVRYGWQIGARVGLIGASDSHSQMPGVNDDRPDDGSPAYHSHDPGGYAVALVDSAAAPRDGIFDAMGGRRTYATSGVRAWLDFTADVDGVPHPMGSEAVGTCQIQFDATVAAGRTVRSFTLFRAHLEPGSPYEAVRQLSPDTEIATLSFTERNPRMLEHGAVDEWVYYVRAMVGTPLDPARTSSERWDLHQDAVWSSPIFVTWPTACSSALTLDVSPIVAGADVVLDSTGASAGAQVAFLQGRKGSGPCPAELGGMCVDLLGAVELGRVTADASGVATLVTPASPTTPTDRNASFQAVEVAGAASMRSPVVRVRTGLYGHSDGFDGPGLDPSWLVLNGGLMTSAVDAGSLTLTPNQVAQWQDASTGPLVYKEVSGDFSVTTRVQVRSAAAPTLPPAQAEELGGLMVRAPAAPSEDHVAVLLGMDVSELASVSMSTDEGVSTSSATPWPSGDGQVRLCRVGPDVTVLRRNGPADAWVEVDTWTRPDLPATLQVGVVVSTPSAVPDLVAHFDEVVFRDVVGAADCSSDS